MEKTIVTAVKGIVERDGLILIVRRPPPADEADGGRWELPGGTIDFGEHPEDALRREMREETGLEVAVGNIAYVTSVMKSAARQIVIITYRCHSDSDQVVLSSEHTEYRWADREELLRLLPVGMLAELMRSGVLAE